MFKSFAVGFRPNGSTSEVRVELTTLGRDAFYANKAKLGYRVTNEDSTTVYAEGEDFSHPLGLDKFDDAFHGLTLKSWTDALRALLSFMAAGTMGDALVELGEEWGQEMDYQSEKAES